MNSYIKKLKGLSIKKIKTRLKIILDEILFYLFRIFPIKSNKIVFSNFIGRGYGDNPKYIAEEIIKQNLNYDMVWLVDKEIGDVKTIPSEIRVVEYGTFKAIYELATAGIWIDNVRKSEYIRKRKNQYYIQTWHGGLGIKKIEGDVEEALSKGYLNMAKKDSKMIDLMISNSTYLTDLYKRAFWYDGEILECGCPKNDILFNYNKNISEKVHKYYGVSKDKKILLYVPTFRVDGSTDCYNIDFKSVLGTLKEKTKSEWVAIIRLHPNLIDKVDFISYDENIINGTLYPDMVELAIASDALISDYSSCVFDSEMLGIPTFIYASDKESYMNDRGFYFQLEELPFLIAEDNEQLMNNIINFDMEKYKLKIEEFHNKVGLKESGKAAKLIVEKIKSLNNEVED
ncbi:CDP-glycerol glycerophosphotransferase family protein [Clostridium sp. AL.422]|uniref:CDP-glycerol glycerophosphotransferase family protein n=1 Tax=Clostridium TaxID=1485 RepID=UPI00293DA654|nr:MULTISPECIES: CDP-glycerol glycerophosphotransferase family protein [unclassified Clostridium]MDV4150404.1 CDP-glycerol glycerophosphotransferase family protein [Clostridium sp. AL.422]